jgi:ABC-2 type transport system permease protein
MRSKTYCFNAALYRKTVLRLWPIWVAAAAIFFFALPATLLQQFNNDVYLMAPGAQYVSADTTYRLIRVVPVVMALLACVTAMFVWNWMFTARSANCYFSVPLRREGLFLTNYLAGLTITLLPLVITLVLTLAVELCNSGLHWVSLLTVLGCAACAAVLFFSLATLCAVATGNMFAVPIFFVVLNILVYGIYVMLMELGSGFIFGMNVGDTPHWVLWCSPFVKLTTDVWPFTDEVIFINNSYFFNNGVTNAWFYPVYLAVGVVLTVPALLAFRRRPAESAGDLIAFRWLKPVFQIGLALCFGIAMTLFVQAVYFESQQFGLTLVMVVLWSLIGYLGAEMLLRKTFRVFHARTLATWGAMAVVTVLLLCAAKLDLFGYVRYIPAEDDVASVKVTALGYDLEIDYETAAALHQAILDGGRSGDEWNVTLTYTLRSGRTVTRRYDIDRDTSEFDLYYAMLTTPESLKQIELGGMESPDQVLWMSVYSYDFDYEHDLDNSTNAEEVEQIFNAILADCEAGESGLDYMFYGNTRHEWVAYLDIAYYTEPYDSAVYSTWGAYTMDVSNDYASFTVTDNMTNTVAVLQSLGYLDGQ